MMCASHKQSGPLHRTTDAGKHRKWKICRLPSVKHDRAPIKFEIPAAGEEYLDLCNSMLYVKVKVMTAAEQDLAGDAQVAPMNIFLHSLFSQVDISLNGMLVTTASDMYDYRSCIETLLSYSRDAKQTKLTFSLYYKDEASKFDNVDLDGNDANPGYVWRNQFIRLSR